MPEETTEKRCMYNAVVESNSGEVEIYRYEIVKETAKQYRIDYYSSADAKVVSKEFLGYYQHYYGAFALDRQGAIDAVGKYLAKLLKTAEMRVTTLKSAQAKLMLASLKPEDDKGVK